MDMVLAICFMNSIMIHIGLIVRVTSWPTHNEVWAIENLIWKGTLFKSNAVVLCGLYE